MKNNIDFSFINDFSKWMKEESVNKDFNIKKNQKVYPKHSNKLSSKIIVEEGCYKEEGSFQKAEKTLESRF